MGRPRLLIAGTVVLLAVAVLGLAFLGGHKAPPVPPTFPAEDLEPAVAQRLRKARARVLAEPDSAEAWGVLGMTADTHGLLPRARTCYQVAARLDPGDWRWPFLHALALPDGAPETVIGLLRRVRDLAPGEKAPARSAELAADLHLAHHLLRSGRPEEARPRLEAVLEQDPRSSHALLMLARIALGRGEEQEALELLDRAAAAAPSHREVHALAARVHAERGEEDAAREAARRASVLPPAATPLPNPLAGKLEALGASSSHMHQRGLTLLAQGQATKALGLLRRAVAARPHDRSLRLDLARALERTGDRAGALETVAAVLEAEPGNARARRLQALMHVRAGRLDAARPLLRRLLVEHPGDTDLRYRLGRGFLKAQRPREALEILLPGIHADPPHYGLLGTVAWLLATLPDSGLRDGEQAVALAERVLRESPSVNRYLHLGTLAAAYAETGRFDEACRTARRALQEAQRAGSRGLVRELEQQLAAYRAGRPWRSRL